VAVMKLFSIRNKKFLFPLIQKPLWRSDIQQRLHLRDCCLVEQLESLALREFELDVFCIDAFHICENDKLFYGGVISYVSFFSDVYGFPLFRRHPE
jgi:hypothetical protein